MKFKHKLAATLTISTLILTIYAAPANSVRAQEEGPSLANEQAAIVNSTSSGTVAEYIGAGGNHSCGVKGNGAIDCWGDLTEGQDPPPAAVYSKITSGGKHDCVLKNNGSVKCWGWNGEGQTKVPSGTFKEISAGWHHTCGVMSDGSAKCWGNDDWGQSTPPGGTFIQIGAGVYHTCGIHSSGSVVCWGDNAYNQSAPPSGFFSQVTAGSSHTCGIKTDGLVQCWGYDGDGQSTPPAGTFKQISAGWDHTCGVKTNGLVNCWGLNDEGQATPPTDLFTQVSAGSGHTCGLKHDGLVKCWGAGEHGQSTPPSTLFGLPPTPTTFQPHGNTYTNGPTYSWARIPWASTYRLVVYGTSPITRVLDEKIDSSSCSTTTNRCSFTSPTTLSNASIYKWLVLATNTLGSSSYSIRRTFKILPGFNSQFNGSSSGWVTHPGGAWSNGSTSYFTNGLAAKYSSASRNRTFSNFTYQARVKQSSTNAASFWGLIVRGALSFNADNSWKYGLFFVINQDGKFKVYKNISGTLSTLKDWTTSPAILKNDWNTLKVTADGSDYKFAINGTLVWSGSDTSRTFGRVGLLSFSQSTAEKFEADWATLTMSDLFNKSLVMDLAIDEPGLQEIPAVEEKIQP